MVHLLLTMGLLGFGFTIEQGIWNWRDGSKIRAFFEWDSSIFILAEDNNRVGWWRK